MSSPACRLSHRVGSGSCCHIGGSRIQLKARSRGDRRALTVNKRNEQAKPFRQVQEEEFAEIRRRRVVKGCGPLADENVKGTAPPSRDLAGLALSGGGIRSATFALGVLESLRKAGFLRRVDYLSTVSGGGYIGAWLSANCLRAAERRAELNKSVSDKVPVEAWARAAYEQAARDWLAPDADWECSKDHLRRYSNYLSPKLGFLSADTWAMVTVWSRNMLLVQTTVIFALACLLALPRLLYQPFIAWPGLGDWRWLSVILFVIAAAGITGNLMRLNDTGKPPRLLEADAWWKGALVGGGLIVLAFLASSKFKFEPFANGPIEWWKAFAIASLIVLAGFCLLPLGLFCVRWLYALFGKSEEPPRQINYGQGWVQMAVVLPMLLAAFQFSAVLWGLLYGSNPASGLLGLGEYSKLLKGALDYWPFPIAIAFVSLGLLAGAGLYRSRCRIRKAVLLWFFGTGVSMGVLHLLMCGLVLLMRAAHDSLGVMHGVWLTLIFGPGLILYAFSLTVVVQIGMLGRQASESGREWWSRLAAWMGIYGTGWLVFCLAAIYGPLLAAWLVENFHYLATAVSTWVGTTLAGLLAGKSGHTRGDNDAAGGPQGRLEKGLEVVTVVGPFVFIAGLLVLVSTLVQALVLALADINWQGMGDWICWHWDWLAGTYEAALVVAVGAGALLLLFAWRVDINEFSLNSFYRTRLSRCYLGATRFFKGERQPQHFTGFDEADDLPLAALAGKAPDAARASSDPLPAPLHLVNCALNLGGSSDLALHTRHGASFVFSPLAVGTSYPERRGESNGVGLGFRPVASYGGKFTAPSLAKAISVSGAAASPNMGYHTSPLVAFLLTVFNVRLGWWFPNPSSACRHSSPQLNLKYLLTELVGGAKETSQFLMISDGGHFENLGAYELIRRHCRIIVISDAECDPEMGFNALGTLIRMCEVDFGVRIDIDIRPLVPDSKTKLSERSFVLGTIHYEPGAPITQGRLIYLKASLSDIESTDVRQYKASHPAFPHETTGDQFYGEDQFESYRQLGKCVAQAALDDHRCGRLMSSWCCR